MGSPTRVTIATTATGRRNWLLQGVLFLGSLAVSAAGSWIPSIWTDEGATISGATRSLPALWALTQNIDMVHGLYYALLGTWFQLVPLGAFSLRLPSALAIAVSTVLVYRLARHWAPQTTAVLAASIFAVLPRTTWMGVEGRSWALSTLVGIGLGLVALNWATDGRRRWLAAYAVLSALGIALHLYLVFLLLAHGVALARRHRRSPLGMVPWVASAAAGFALAAPVWLVASRQSAQLGEQKPGPAAWARQFAVNQVFLGETPSLGSTGLLDLAWKVSSVGLAVVGWALVVAAVVAAASRRRGALADDGLWWLVPWSVLPPFLVLAWSAVGRNMYNPRYFGFCVPAVAVLLAVGIAGLGQLRRQLVVLLVVAALAAPVYVSQRITRAKAGSDWSEVAAWVAHRAAKGDGVYFAPTPTTRTISIAYPASFSGLTDITLVRPAAEDASLAGESMPLALAVATAPTTVFAIWRVGAEGASQDRQVLTSAGFLQTEEWAGSLDEVARFVRR